MAVFKDINLPVFNSGCLLARLLFTALLLVSLTNPASASGASTSDVAATSVSSSRKIELDSREKLWLEQKIPVRVRLSNTPPYHMASPEPKGISVDYLKIIGKRFGINFLFVPATGTWQEAFNDLAGERKNHDLILSMTRTPEREKLFALTTDYLSSPWVIFNRAGDNIILQIQDLNGKKVAVEKGFVLEERLAREYPQIKIIPVVTSLDCLKSVADGTSDAYIGNLAIATYWIHKNGLNNLRVAAPSPFGNQDMSMAVRNDWPELAGILSKAFASMPEAEKAEIRNRWISIKYEYGISRQQALQWFGAITVLFSVILAVSLAWNRRLKREIGYRIKAENRLKKSNETFSLFMHYSPVYVFIKEVTSGKSRVLQASENFKDMVGISGSDMIGKTMEELFPAEFAAKITADDWNVVTKGEKLAIEEEFNGRHYSTIKFPLVQDDRTLLAGFTIDITNQKKVEEERLALEKQLLHTQKLESLGVLAGGIAHDFNNILMAIIGNADLALMRINKESPVVEFLHQIEKAAARAADLSKQMLAYSGKGKFIIENINLNNLLEDMLNMLQSSISKKAALRFNPHENLPSVEADATQIRQVVMNLVINASEAIGDNNGFIAINTGCMDCDRNYLKDILFAENSPEGLYVYLEVADNGCGMDNETITKLFDPFFTTKFTGRGLGMAAVLGIIRGHKGGIKVYSEPGKGTTFKILLPASDIPPETRSESGNREPWNGNGTVLLVDDEETVLSIGSELLKELGFTTLTASNGREAIEIFRSRQDISFVILDLTMPHMDGEECFRELRKLDPGIKVIISSGYNEHDVTQRFSGMGLSGFIQKPYKLSELQTEIRKISG